MNQTATIQTIKRDFNLFPNIVGITTTADLAAITAADYWKYEFDNVVLINKGIFNFYPQDLVLIYYSPAKIGFFTFDFINQTFVSLVPNGVLSDSLLSGHIFVGNASNIATDVAMSGDATISNAGVLTIANNAVTTSKILNSNVTYGKIQNVAASRLLGNPTGGATSVSEISPGATLAFIGTALQTTALSGDVTSGANSFATTIAANAVTTAKILNSNVTYGKIQNVAAVSLLGNPTGGATVASEITLGDGLSFVGTDLVAPIRIKNVITFGTPGVNTFTVPATTTQIYSELWGAGAGGGGADATVGAAGAGGGSGAHLIALLTVNPGEDLTITIGAGGAGGTNAGTNGTRGEDSTISGAGLPATLTAGGGFGGQGSTSGVITQFQLGGAPGVATNGDANMGGSPGQCGLNSVYGGGGGGTGGGAPTVGAGNNAAGIAGGGGGAGTNNAGGNGADGFAVLYYYS